MTTIGRGFLALATLGALLATTPITRAQGHPATATPANGDFAGLVDVGGHELYLECRGTGSPTVVLEAGYRSPATIWTDDLVQPDAPRTMVLPGVAAFTRVCTYERPGTAVVLDGAVQPSRSQDVPMPRRVVDMVADLHALLHTAGVPGPYVLVGHSLGGLLVQLYASTYPQDVVGMVLVDALPDQMRTFMTPAQWQFYVQLALAVPDDALAQVSGYETVSFDDAATGLQQARAAAPLRQMPLYVLSKGQPWDVPGDPASGFSAALFERAWVAGQQDLALLLPDARHSVATDSGHDIELEQPQLVIDAIREVVDGVRDPSTWYGAPVQLPREAQS